mgnify:CR=1 FL=1
MPTLDILSIHNCIMKLETLTKNNLGQMKKEVVVLLEKAKNTEGADALSLLQEAKKLVETAENLPLQTIHVYSALGHHYFKTHDVELGNKHFLKVLRKVPDATDGPLDEDLRDLLTEQCSVFSLGNCLDLYRQYLGQVRKLAFILEDQYLKEVYQYFKGINHYYRDEIKIALDETISLINSCKKSKNDKMLGKSYFLLAHVYINSGIYDKALEAGHRALELSGKVGDIKLKAAALNIIGMIYGDYLKDNQQSIRYYLQAKAIWEEVNYTHGLGVLLNNLGSSYLKEQEYDLAKKYLLESLDIKNKIGNKQAIATTFANLGNVSLAQENYKEAEKHFLKALKGRKECGHIRGIVTSGNALAKLYIVLGRYDEAEEYLNQGEENSIKKNLEDRLEDIHLLRKNLYKKLGRFEEALVCYDKYTALKEKIFSDKMADKFSVLTEVYESREKEQKIQFLKEQNALERKAKKRIQTLMRELHHRVTNNLDVLKTILRMQSRNVEDGTLKEAIKAGEARVVAMAMIHKQLYGEGDITVVNVNKYLTDLVEYVMCAYNYNHQNFKLITSIKVEDLEVDIAIPLGLMVNELAMNAMKYAYKNQPNPSLTLALKRLENGHLNLSILDNGVNEPFEIDLEKAESFGLKLVNMLTEQLDGEAELKQNKQGGLHCNLVFDA